MEHKRVHKQTGEGREEEKAENKSGYTESGRGSGSRQSIHRVASNARKLTLDADTKERLDRLYLNPKLASAYSSRKKLLDAALSGDRPHVDQYLRGSDVYTRYFQPRSTKRYTVNSYLLTGPNELLQVDLIDVQRMARYNDKKRFILSAIDVFSKLAQCEPLLNKSGRIVSLALQKIFEKLGNFRYMQSDAGKEFYNRHVAQILKNRRVVHIPARNSVKASVVERFNRTIQTYLFKALYNQGSYRYLTLLPKLVQKYNNSVHRAIGTTPARAANDLRSRYKVWRSLYLQHWSKIDKSVLHRRSAIKAGDYVRILIENRYNAFSKGYYAQFSRELFRVVRVRWAHRSGLLAVPVYSLVDLSNSPISGEFYREELRPVDYSEQDQFFDVERVIRKRATKEGSGQEELLVKFVGYPGHYWIRNENVRRRGEFRE